MRSSGAAAVFTKYDSIPPPFYGQHNSLIQLPRGKPGPANMNRFAFTTLLAALAFFAIGFSLHGPTRWGAFTVFWIVYLTIVGFGVALIQLQFFGPAICRSGTKVALTFDDGPDPTVTPILLDLLAREKIPAAFFCIGKNVAANPDIAARIANDGHLIGNHTYNHNWWTAFLSRDGLTGEISLTQDAISNAAGVKPIYLRPPMGLTNPHYAGVLKRLRLFMVGWDVRSMDTLWSSQKVIGHVLRNTRPGSIILLHDGGSSPERIVQIVGEIILGLRARGFEFERLDKLIGQPGSTIQRRFITG